MVKRRGKKESNDSEYIEDKGHDPSRFVASDLLNILLIGALVIIFFLPVVFGGKVFFGGDVMNVYNPYQAINAEQLAAGKMPLWTDRFFCGFPLFAESQGALFYPPTRLAYLLAPLSHAFTLDALFHFFIAGMFMYILARYLGQRPVAALIAATAFGFSGLLCSLIINFTIFRSAAWIPIIFYLTRRCLLERGLKWTFLLTLSIVFQMMGGSLQVTAITILLIFIDGVYIAITQLAKRTFLITLVRILKVVAGIGFAVGLYAFQLLPTWELTGLAWRGVEATYEIAASYSFPPGHLIDILMPNFYGDPAKSNMLPGIPPAPNYFGYIGVIAIGLAIYALGSRRSGIFWPIGLLFILLSLGPAGKIFDALYYAVPFFDKFRAPDRFLIVFMFCAALLAGFGAERIASRDDERVENNRRSKKEPSDEEDEPRPRGRYIFLMFILIVIAVIGMLPWFGSIGKVAFDGILLNTIARPLGIVIDGSNFAQYEAWRNGVPLAILYFVAFAAAIPLCNLLFGRAAGGRGLIILFLILNSFDLFLTADVNHNCNLINGRFFAEDPKSVEFIKDTSPQSRIYSFGRTNHAKNIFGDKYITAWYQGGGGSDDDYFRFREIVAPNLSAYFDLYDAGGFASLYTEDFYLFEGIVVQQLKDIAQGMSVPSVLNNGRPLHLLLDTMAADYIISGVELPDGERFQKVYEGDVRIYKNKMALPRAYVVHPHQIAEVDTTNIEQLAQFASSIGGFDFEGNIILPTTEGIPTFSSDRAGISTNITPTLVEPGRIEINVEINRPGVFVLADSFYPGWKAKVDGKETEILRANLYYRGVVLKDPGVHEVEFYFNPSSFRKGKLISIFSLVLFILLIVGKGFLDRWYRSDEPEPEQGTVKVVRYSPFGKKVTYEEEDE